VVFVAEEVGGLKEAVHQGGFPVVNVGYDGDVSYVFSAHGRESVLAA
jgi:hypothetical protein